MTDIIFLDTETTGLDPHRHTIIDIWAERRRTGSLELIAAGGGHVAVSAEELDAASPRALEVNGDLAQALVDARECLIVSSLRLQAIAELADCRRAPAVPAR